MKPVLLSILIPFFINMGCAMRSGSGSVTTLKVDDFTQIVAQKEMPLIDVRTPKEFAEGHIDGAVNIDVKASNFAERVQSYQGKVAVYCRGGRRSLSAAKILAAQGCTVYNLDGGILAWQKAGRPTVK